MGIEVWGRIGNLNGLASSHFVIILKFGKSLELFFFFFVAEVDVEAFWNDGF